MIDARVPVEVPVTLIGHPFATVGMGEQLRSHIAACRSVNFAHQVLDIYQYASRTDADHVKLVQPVEIQTPTGGIRIFHINGDEVDPVLRAFEARGGRLADGYNIVVPAWELPTYPSEWATNLRRFDEIWALSRFIQDGLKAVNLTSTLIGQAVEVPLGYFLPRKYFGIRESSFALLHFFDLSSYASRKNPEAVLEVFEALKARREYEDIQLVLKVKNGDRDGAEWVAPIRERVPEAILISKPLTALETRSLINCSDCFVSLHRAEGFGRGTGEAMFLGRLALGTGWSGNVDYMGSHNSLLVDYDLVPVKDGDYPHSEGQHWANARISHAVELLEKALEDRQWARAVAAAGRREIRLGHSFRAVGLRIMARVVEIATSMASIEKHSDRGSVEEKVLESKPAINRSVGVRSRTRKPLMVDGTSRIRGKAAGQ